MTGEPTTAYPGFGNYGPAGSTAPSDTRPTRRPLAWNGGTDIGLLLLRLGIGGVVFAHGAQKVFGLWGGTGIAGFATNLEGLGYQQATTLSWLTGVTELIAGAFLVLGLLTPLAAAAVLAIMINAVLLKLGNGFFVTGPKGSDAIELSLVLGLGAACLVLTGPGRIALDNGRAWHRRPASWGVLALVIGVAAAVLVYVLLRRPVIA
jgi:putative oxidoreductase